MFLSTYHPQPILLELGPVTIHWYGLLLALSAVAGFFLLLRLAKPHHIDTNTLYDLFVALVIGGFLGGRLYHVSNEWTYYRAHAGEILKVWNGGLAIHGAILVGVLITWYIAKRKKISFGLLLDLLAPALVLGQVIGRWGNYFNQELFGGPTNLPWKLVIDEAHRPSGYLTQQFFHPTFLYESLGSLLVLVLLLWLLRTREQRRPWASWWTTPGSIFATYLFTESIVRIIVELFRIDRVPVMFGVRLPILVSGGLILLASYLLVHLRSRAKR